MGLEMKIKYRVKGEEKYIEERCYKYEYNVLPNKVDAYMLLWTLGGTKFIADVEHVIVEIVSD